MTLLELVEKWWFLLLSFAGTVYLAARYLFYTRTEGTALDYRIKAIESERSRNPITDLARKRKMERLMQRMDLALNRLTGKRDKE